ncbi:MAG: acyl carrier protein [Bacteroidota bacterium]|jgi:acyl carrier protein
MQDQTQPTVVDGERIVEAVCEILQQHNPRNIPLQPETKITSELNIDSVEVMDLVMEIEQRFDIDIPISMLSDVETIGDLANVVATRVRDR